MNDRVMDQEEVMRLVSDVLESASDTKSARNGLINLVNNPAYNISSHLKSVFLHVASSDEALEEFRSEINSNALDEGMQEPVVIPETQQNIFFDKLMGRRVRRSRLLEDRVIIPYDDNNKPIIYALMDKAVSNKYGFILANLNDSASFIYGSANKNIDGEEFYRRMNTMIDLVDANKDYLDDTDEVIVKIVHLFDNAISHNTSFSIGLTPRESGNEIIVSSDDSLYIEKLKENGLTVNDGKIRISGDFLNALDKVDQGFASGMNNSAGLITSVNYSLYDSKKIDGTIVATELYEEVVGNNVYMSTNISNVDALVDVKRDYLFTSKDNFAVVKKTFFADDELVEQRTDVNKEEKDSSLSCVFTFEDGKTKSWGTDVTVDNYGEVSMLYSQLATLPSLKENETLENSQGVSRGGQVLVKSNPNLPPTLPSQEKAGGINNSGFSSTFLFVTLIALELTAIAFGIFMFVK